METISVNINTTVKKMAKPKVLQLGKIEQQVTSFPNRKTTRQLTSPPSAQDSWAALGEVADIIKPQATNRAEFIEECKSGALDGVVAIYRTFSSVKITGKIDAELVAALPSSVGFICHNGNYT